LGGVFDVEAAVSDSTTTCPYCKRLPGGIHKDGCAIGRRYRKPVGMPKPPKVRKSQPVADIRDCVAGPIKVKWIE